MYIKRVQVNVEHAIR